MAKRIPVTIDAEVVEVDVNSALSSMVPVGTKSIVTANGNIIRASDFDRYRAQDVQEGFDTQAATIQKAGNVAGDIALLSKEVSLLNKWLSGFEPCEYGSREAFLSPTGEFVGIRNFPLPDSYKPDHIQLVLYVLNYPVAAPIGIYLATKGEHGPVVNQISSKLNVFRNSAFHGAETPLPGYQWVCLIPDQWKINRAEITKGQNLQKYLAHFFGLLGE